MKSYIFSTALALTLLGCEFQSFEDYEYKPYDGEFQWTQLTKNAEWPNRYGHAALAYDNKLWVFGGYNPGVIKGDTYYEDVWNSADGISWALIEGKAPWHGRRGHQVLVFNDGGGDAMYLIGGFAVNEETGYREYTNDVWKSVNGKDWEQLKPRTYPELDAEDDWFPRFNHGLVTATHGGINYMYIIAGASMMEERSARYAMKYFNDVWRSIDGISWEKMKNNDFGIRSEAGVTVNPSTGKIFIQGGIHGVIFEEDGLSGHPLEDWHWIWSSLDGETWLPENDTAMFDQGLLWRSDHHLIYYKDALWGLPGKTTSSMHYHLTTGSLYPMWKRVSDGVMTVDSYGIDVDPRHGYATAILDDQIYILGGFTSSYGQSNDVWSGEIN